MEIESDIIGRGWSFPPEFVLGGDTGEVVMTEGKDDINKSLQILLNVGFGEMLMVPEYGCDLRRFLFDPINAKMEAYINKIVQEAILYFEPRIRPENVSLEVDEGKIEITVTYIVKTTNSRYNFVFPLY